MKKLLIRISQQLLATEIYVGKALLKSSLIKDFFSLSKGSKIIIADQAVQDLYAAPLANQIGGQLLSIPRGESAKTLETAQYLLEALFKNGAGRDTTLIAIGGGATTDLVAFVASIYMRGVPLILIPTTLLSIVDASLGGKTAIDTPFGKNLIGTIYPPKAIFADLDTLQTLPETEWFNGLAEIWKLGLVYDAVLWQKSLKDFLKGEKDISLILKAMQGKIDIVQQDPREQSLRHILNFGHTIGHALEKVSRYEMPHGQAVALGCYAEAHLSMSLGYLSAADFEQIERAYSLFPLQLPKDYARPKLFEAMAHDKKKALGQIRTVLIEKIGCAIPFEGDYCQAVTPREWKQTLDWMEENYNHL